MTKKRTRRMGRLAAWLCVGWASVLAAGEAGSETPGAVGAASGVRSIVGAIRWDAWHGDAGLQGPAEVFPVGPQRETPGLAVERSLGPAHWHYRLPFYERLIQAALDAGLEQPYLVDMGQSPGVPADARSGYLGGSVPAVWDQWKAEGHKVIPHVSAGFDRRPRVENPVPWESNFGNPRPVQGGRLRTAEQAAAEIASGVKNALDWNRANREAGEANAIIIYAWNEFDEGGWICPTLSEGTARLDAIGRVLSEAERESMQYEQRTLARIIHDDVGW